MKYDMNKKLCERKQKNRVSELVACYIFLIPNLLSHTSNKFFNSTHTSQLKKFFHYTKPTDLVLADVAD